MGAVCYSRTGTRVGTVGHMAMDQKTVLGGARKRWGVGVVVVRLYLSKCGCLDGKLGSADDGTGEEDNKEGRRKQCHEGSRKQGYYRGRGRGGSEGPGGGE